jgi:hypothetical protein
MTNNDIQNTTLKTIYLNDLETFLRQAKILKALKAFPKTLKTNYKFM